MAAAPKQDIYAGDQGYPLNQWYVAAFSSELDGAAVVHRRLLDIPVLLYRTEAGEAAALYDRCPHRGLPLSMGTRIGDRIRCGYHGMEFGSDGRCAHIPSQLAKPSNMAVRRYPLIEKWRWLWIWVGDFEKADPRLIPDHDWLGLTRADLSATPFFMMEMACNYQYMHDNLLDSTHVSFLHPGSLDEGNQMASAKVEMEEAGQILRISFATPGTVFSEAVAGYFRVKPGHRYDRVLVNETYAPSVSIGKQKIRDPENPSAPAVELYAINALTPASRRHTYVHHVQLTSSEADWKPSDIENVRSIVAQDKVALEALQHRYDEFGDADEVSVKSDSMGVRCRRIIQTLLSAESKLPARAQN